MVARASSPSSTAAPRATASSSSIVTGASVTTTTAGAAGTSLLAPAKRLDHLAGLLVAVLHGRRLHEVGRRAEQRAADAAVLGQLGAAHGVDDDAGRVGRVPHLELQLHV